MSIKTKLTSLITTFLLLCSLLTVGVFAVKNTTFNVGGKIEFNVKGIEATITRGECTGFTAEKTIGNEAGNILSDITLDNTMSADDVADAFAPWSGLNLAFDNATTATIKLTITNTAEEGADNYLDITALATATTKNNAKVSVVNDAGGITALLEPQQSASFTITFSVINDEYSASLEGFSVNFDMQKKVLADFPSYDADSRLTIECNTTTYTARIEGNSITAEDSEVVLPRYVKKDGEIFTLTEIAWEYGLGGSPITSIVIPETFSKIGEMNFYGCGNLRNISLPESIKEIGEYAFQNCSSLKSITIPESVEIVRTFAFQYSGIETIRIPNGIVADIVGEGGPKNIIIGEGVTSISGFYGENTGFYGSYSITSIQVESGNKFYESAPNNSGVIEKSTKKLIIGLNNIVIPNYVEEIADHAFGEFGINFTEITIPSSVKKIGEAAFLGCSNLTTVNYTGTQAQWNTLLENIGEYNEDLINANINFNYTGE